MGRMLQSCLQASMAGLQARMEDILITILKVVLLLVMLGAAIIIFAEIVAMARGRALPRAGQGQREEA